ncbi:hypothetical protein FC83_GL000398 [Agrilactobacillus composti DSM 18527 = JCM 14202]|uniref:Uncharacterized protein n=2 Tax=Agrilactobacillus TaxID=2767875 RepID=X0QNH5_9LACO|nr:hypothetical protein FC83_GL000398 [Agrilactobacillus composti DSM 18527 = JCM 14202]GAF40165.1 hypothetical protein JCM14202_2054 [Agrilactobacillus composti DSM 18527 = JCM 14202]
MIDMPKAVFHIDELDKWPHALANVQNLWQYGQAQQLTYDVVVLVNGAAITGYLQAQLQAKIAILQQQGIHFHACQNAMASHDITPDFLPAGVLVVPAGVADLIALQDAGYRYIKP